MISTTGTKKPVPSQQEMKVRVLRSYVRTCMRAPRGAPLTELGVLQRLVLSYSFSH